MIELLLPTTSQNVGSAEGLLVFTHLTGCKPGLASKLIDEYFTKQDIEAPPIIPLIDVESDMEDDFREYSHYMAFWPALITGGRTPYYRNRTGVTHFDISLTGHEKLFLTGIVGPYSFKDRPNTVEALHLRIGKVSIGKGIVSISTTASQPFISEDLFSQSP